MSKNAEDRCQLYEQHGSRRTHCSQPREMQYQVHGHNLIICFKHWGYEPAKLDEVCRLTIKMLPKEEEAP